MKHIYFLSIAFLVSLSALAVPSMRLRRSVQLTDGSFVMATLYGDEHHSFLLADDGYVLEPAEQTPRRYLRTQRTLATERLHSAAAHAPRHLAPHHIGSQATAALPAFGSPKIPVILVNFADSVFSVAETDDQIHEYYDLYCNGTRDGNLYKGHGSYGSVRDYFAQQSDSLFLPEFVIIGPVTLNNPAGYYGRNTTSTKDVNYSQFRNEAVRAAKELYGDDWSVFDNRQKGQVDMVFLLFAGCGEANGGGDESIWPKDSPGSVTMDGTFFASSACCNEMILSPNGPTPDGIGIMCHELSHALGLPDFYDTGYHGFGMDIWSIMDYGCYTNNGYTPCAYTAYERDFMGWRPLQQIEGNGFFTLQPTEMGGTAYKVVNDENPDEYYVLENRQRAGWDNVLGRLGHGMQVTHVDFSALRWNGNTVNTDPDHQRMTIIAANDRYIGSTVSHSMAEMRITWRGNLYPFVEDGNVINDSLTSLSTPAAKVFSDSGLMHKDINSICENEDLSVSFYFGNDFGTAVSELQAAPATSPVFYDLSGRRVQHPSHGLYIVNGQKMQIP